MKCIYNGDSTLTPPIKERGRQGGELIHTHTRETRLVTAVHVPGLVEIGPQLVCVVDVEGDKDPGNLLMRTLSFTIVLQLEENICKSVYPAPHNM